MEAETSALLTDVTRVHVVAERGASRIGIPAWKRNFQESRSS